jgi:2-polyprenyl-3-methyl-5-hydroxy-6-metoxy-1,4-benzoquinol methylase
VSAATPATLTPEALRAHKLFDHRDWYYSLELLPGVYSPGKGFNNVGLTRDLLRRTAVEGRRCLDVGIMEGLVTMLMERRGAAQVVGYDRVERPNMMKFIRSLLNARYEHVTGVTIAGLPAALRAKGHTPFDVVVFSGVLYHMFDPLAGLAAVRGLVRNGGILLVETAATLDDSIAMHFNAAGRFFGGTNYWEPSLPCLDYMLRFLRLRPLDCIYLNAKAHANLPLPVGRVCIACRAVDAPVAESHDDWMRTDRDRDFSEFLDWDAVATDAAPVPYDAARAGLVFRDRATGTIDVAASVRAMDEFPVGPEQCRLALSDKY